MSTFRNSVRTSGRDRLRIETSILLCSNLQIARFVNLSVDQFKIRSDRVAGVRWNPPGMALRISATGFVSILFVMVLTIRPGCVAGNRTRLWHGGSAGVRGNMMASSDCTSWREKGLIADGDELGRKSWRKLLFARRRRSAPVVVESAAREEEPAAATKKLQAGRASLSRFAAAFSFFSSMAKGSPSPSPATPSPGHN